MRRRDGERRRSALDGPRESLRSPAAESQGVRLARFVGLLGTGRALRDFSHYLPAQMVSAVAGVLVLPVLARELRPTYLGVLAIAQTLVTLIWVVAGGWLTSTVLRELPDALAAGTLERFRRRLKKALALSGGAVLGFAGLMAAAAVFSAALRFYGPLILAGAVGQTLQNVSLAMLAAELRPRLYAWISVVGRVGGIGAGVALVFAGGGVAGYLLGLAGVSILAGSIGLTLAWPRGGTRVGGDAALGGWVRYGVGASSGGVATWALSFADRYLLGGLRGPADVGIYSVGTVIGDRPVTIPALAFMTAARPLLVGAYERTGLAEVERLMRAYTRLVLLMSVPTIALVAAVATPLIAALAGPRYAAAAPVVPIVAVGSLFTVLASIAITGLVVARRTLPVFWGACVGLAVNVVANLVLIPPLGIKGAAIATPIGNFAYLAASYGWSRPFARWRFPTRTLVRSALAAGCAYSAARAAQQAVGSHVAEIGVALAAGGLVYALVLVALGERREEATILPTDEPPIEAAARPNVRK